MSLLLNILSTLVISLLPRSKRLLISWLQSPSAVIWEPPKIKSFAGGQREESHRWQGHVEGSLTKCKDKIRLQGFPLEFPEHPPPQKIRICLLFHSSNILWKKSTQGFSLLHLKGMFQLNPSDSSLACLTGSPDLLQLVNCLQPPNRERHKA